MKKISKISALLLAVSMIFLCSCSNANEVETTASATTKSATSAQSVDYHKDTNPVATITMEDGKVIKIELYPEIAPNTVNNFISLAGKGFYDGLVFHRAIANTIIQGGDPKGNGTGGPGYTIKGEMTVNGFTNNLKHTRGVISMARSNSYDSAGSQFFLVNASSVASWDKNYCAFGMIIEGIENVDTYSKLPVTDTESGTIKQQPKMKSVTVDTKGVIYDEPVTIVK